jgi:hypothetical protein
VGGERVAEVGLAVEVGRRASLNGAYFKLLLTVIFSRHRGIFNFVTFLPQIRAETDPAALMHTITVRLG